MTIEIHPFGDGWDAYSDLVSTAFAASPAPDEYEGERRLFEPDRGIGAYDGDLPVGYTGGWGLWMRVPGAAVPVAGVGPVVVLPTHRRRGILRSLMHRQLTDLQEAGNEPVAALTASEPAIYGRFGYGMATDQVSIQIPRPNAGLRPVEGSDQISVRYADAEKELGLLGRLHRTSTAGRPGSFEQNEGWMRLQIKDPDSTRQGASKLRCVLAYRAGEPTGYALFATKPSWEAGGPNGALTVRRVHGLDLASYAALWRFLLDQDLIGSVHHHHMSLDDPLFALLYDIRRAQTFLRDALWVRLVDVGRALGARTYAHPIDVVLNVVDPTCPWNEGRWRLSGSPEGAVCEPTTDASDLTIDVRELGGGYLGRSSLAALGRAGLVTEHTSGALATASSAFVTDPAPWADTVF